jgi:benzoate/toluate 1,2-dioxygenase subunit beta
LNTLVQLDKEVERLLIKEAALINENRLDEWLDMFTEDCIYWIPCKDDQLDPNKYVSIIYDDRNRLDERVWRLKSGLAYGQEPKSKTRHLITNVDIREQKDDQVVVSSNFLIVELRKGVQNIHAGRFEHHLVQKGDAWKIKFKRVELINNDGFLGNLSFIL